MLPYGGLLGLLGLLANAVLSFEEPQREMLLASALLLVATPLGVLLHLLVTQELTHAQKRAWIAGLVGRNGLAFLAAYLKKNDRRRATHQLARRRRGRRTSG